MVGTSFFTVEVWIYIQAREEGYNDAHGNRLE